MAVRSASDEVRRRLRSWNCLAVLLRLTHVGLGLTGVGLPLIVAVFGRLGNVGPSLLSLAAALSIAVFTAFDVGNRANRFREAWKKLNAGMLRFDEGLIGAEALISLYEQCEQDLGSAKPDPFERAARA